MQMSGKVVVVTGGATGIGAAIVRAFAALGAILVIAELDSSRADALCLELGGAERAIALPCDVRDRDQVEKTVATVLSRFNRIDVWVNNAGYAAISAVADMDVSTFRAVFETNFFGVLHGLKAAIPVMLRQGSGTVINISSVSGHIPLSYGAAYSATKAAVNALGKAARIELAKSNVNVITVSPGYVQTEMIAKGENGLAKDLTARLAKRTITPHRVAEAVVKGYLKGKREVVVPWSMSLAIKLYQLFPSLIERDMARGH